MAQNIMLLVFVVFCTHVCSAVASLRGDDSLSRLPSVSNKPRTFILTDILNEPDDSMSMVRYLLYSNEFDTQGIVATTSYTLRNQTHPEEIIKIIDAYGKVVGNLNKHVSPIDRYKEANYFLSLVSSGPKIYGRLALEQPLSEGAKLLVQRLEESTEPLYVSIWGGANTLAQAVLYISKNRPNHEAATLRSRLRVYSISDQDDTGSWIRQHFPDIFYIVNVHGFLEYSVGTWAGINTDDNGAANVTKVRDTWLTPNIRIGPLGAVYPKIIYGMEGDTPSFSWLIQNGLSNPERPDWGGWGGRYRHITSTDDIKQYGTSQDTAVALSGDDYRSNYATIWRWRDAYQDDFAARMQWTLAASFRDAAHPPVIGINGSIGLEPLRLSIPANESVVLDATETYDTDDPEDGSRLEFEWFFYEEASNMPLAQLSNPVDIKPLSPPSHSNGTLPVNNAGFRNVTVGPRVQITANAVDVSYFGAAEWHVILQVSSNKGPHPIRRYKRVVISTA